MKTIFYLAMTAGELSECPQLPQKPAYMACHFSPYGPGLAELPRGIPQENMMILNDRIPYRRHDSDLIARQLAAIPCECLLLDLQKTPEPEARDLIENILSRVTVPTAVPARYAPGLSCGVFLDAVDADQDPFAAAKDWPGRDIWMDLTPGIVNYRVQKEGSSRTRLIRSTPICPSHKDESLFCRYTLELSDVEASFTLWRDAGDAAEILRQGQKLGVSRGVGLYQEWSNYQLFTAK